MPREREDEALLWDMLEAAKQILGFVAGRSFEEYARDELRQAAVERKLEVIGEAARGVSEEFRSTHPEIPWRGIVSQRHFIAHEYGEIRHEKIWGVAVRRIPELIAMLAPFLPPEKQC
jgi:uncharacterized protein with HEPN domain